VCVRAVGILLQLICLFQLIFGILGTSIPKEIFAVKRHACCSADSVVVSVIASDRALTSYPLHSTNSQTCFAIISLVSDFPCEST